jgi:hypothetical protein
MLAFNCGICVPLLSLLALSPAQCPIHSSMLEQQPSTPPPAGQTGSFVLRNSTRVSRAYKHSTIAWLWQHHLTVQGRVHDHSYMIALLMCCCPNYQRSFHNLVHTMIVVFLAIALECRYLRGGKRPKRCSHFDTEMQQAQALGSQTVDQVGPACTARGGG